MSSIPSLADIRAARERISGKALRTHLIYSEPLSEFTANDVYLKPEGLQPGGAFKYRGATNAISQLSINERKKGVITASSGNHGIAVALAARKAGVKATIIVPNSAPELKVKMICKTGAAIIRYGENYNDCEDRAREITSEEGHFILSTVKSSTNRRFVYPCPQVCGQVSTESRGLSSNVSKGPNASLMYKGFQLDNVRRIADSKSRFCFIHPFEDPRVIAGQGTVGLEIAEDAPPDLHAVLVPVGGGGLISGIALGLGYTRPGVKIIGVEPENCASFHAAHREGKPVQIEMGPTCAGGLHTKRIGNTAFEILKNGPSPVMVSEDDILEATRFCIEKLKFVVEPSGAAGVAALLSGKYEPGGTTVVILSGSNLDRKWLDAALGKSGSP